MLGRYVLILAVLLMPFSARAIDNKVKWISEVGLGIESGLSIREKAAGFQFQPGFAIGPALSVSVARIRMHQVVLGLGYQYEVGNYKGGTEQLQVKTTYQRLVLAPGYLVRYKLITGGVHLGAAMNIATTRETYNELLVEYDRHDEEYQFHKIGELDSQTATGVDFGFFAGIGIGIDFSKLILGLTEKSLFDLVLKADYVRRGERDDIFVGLSIVFWPTGLAR